MKSKKRHHPSSDESDDWDINAKSSSTSESESEESSASEHRHKKKRKRADSSDSDSNSDDAKRSKKRKHKKKKKKHGKKKKRTDSVDSVENISASEGEVASKKKKKHKHKHKRARTSTNTNSEEEEHVEHRLHSVVKERRASSGECNPPARTYYQKEYRRSASVENYEHESEVQRFYRGSSKEHKYREQYNYNRQRNVRYPPQTEKYDSSKEKYGPSGRYHNTHEDHSYKQREYDEYKRSRYEERRPDEEYHKRSREEPYYREDVRANDRFKQYEERVPKRREFSDGRDYRDRRGPPEPDRFREREFVDKREKLHEERYSSERNRDIHRERPGRVEKPQVPRQRVASRSPEERFRDRSKRIGERDGREGRDEREERADREERFEERRSRRAEPEHPSDRPRQRKTRFTDADEKEYTWGKTEVKKEGDKGEGDKEKPNFGLSGKLTADANTVNGVVVKYTEPDDAKQPKRRWRFYPFKGDKALPILYIHRQSCFLIGRDKAVADIPLEHPSVSKQHAALQYRAAPFARADGSQGRRVRPYVIDLDSANGTFVNNKKIEPRRYVELLERDVVKFGFSQREYVLLHENSKDDAQDDDQEPLPATTDQIKHEKRVKEELAADGD